MAAYRGALRTCSNIFNSAFLKYLTALSCELFLQEASAQMFDWVENRLLAKGLEFWAHYSQSIS